MSHTIVNLMQVHDMAKDHGLSPGLESRFARGPLELQQSGLSHFRIGPGFRTPFGHTHHEQEEVYVVVEGSARVKLDDDEIELKPLDAVRIPPGVMRGMAAGPDGAELIAFGAPNNENSDLDMKPGFFE